MATLATHWPLALFYAIAACALASLAWDVKRAVSYMLDDIEQEED